MVTKACRNDWIETGDQDEVILVIDAKRARVRCDLGDAFDQMVRDLVMGIPVAGHQMDRYGVSALGICSEAERAEREAQADLFEYERSH